MPTHTQIIFTEISPRTKETSHHVKRVLSDRCTENGQTDRGMNEIHNASTAYY